MQDAKVCSNTNCLHNGEPQPIDSFRKDVRYGGGFRCQCKDCEAGYYARRSQTTAGRSRSAKRQTRYRKTKKFKLLNAARYAGRNKEQSRARNFVNKQIFRGMFPRASKQACATCGNPAQMYHHHNGYDIEHRMAVIPLCFVCHKAQHASACYS